MLKQTINYVDFNGEERNEEFYFHLSMVEVARLEAKFGCAIDEYAKSLGSDVSKQLEFLETIVLTSYGKKTSDGRSFQKNNDLRSEFENSPAYAELFEKLLLDSSFAQRFGESIADTGKNKKNVVEPQVVTD